MDEKQYREYNAINYSLLAKLSVSPIGIEGDKEERDYFTLGSLVDTLCTDGDNYHNKYYITTASVPSDSMVAYCKELLQSGDAQKAWEASGLKSDPAEAPKNGGDSKFKKEAEAYYNDLLLGTGKQVITYEQNVQAHMLYGVLNTNEFTAKYFAKENMFQVPIIWKYYGRECKSLLDIIHIDYEKETIRPVDLKTTGKSVFSFYRSYIDYKYYIQAAFYTHALNYALQHDPRFSKVKNFKILPFQFIVIETDYKNPPHIFEVDNTDLYIAEHGGKIETAGYEIKGFRDIIEDLEYHNTTNQWDYRRDVYNNEGIINLKALASCD